MTMNAKSIVAIILVVLGIVVLAYSGITFTTPGETVQFLGMRIETRETHFIPPIFGALSLVGGIVLLLLKPGTA
jgi:lipid-A-disaccharide synthase-like uncharacterized protein